MKPQIATVPTSLRRSSFPVLAMLLLAALAGCGPQNDRLQVTGVVKLDGTPLDNGSIRLTSTGTEKLVASGAMIQNGAFTIPQPKGLPPGTYRVEISAPDTSAPLKPQQAGPGEPALPPTAPERIPAEYNSDGKVTVDVTAGENNHFEFDISTRPAK